MKDSVTEAFTKLRPEKQERVYQTAVDEFSSKGYSRASMNVIAREAGVSKGSLFQYFISKSGLFDSILSLATSKVKGYLRQVRDNSAGENFFIRLEKIIRAGFEFIDNHPNLARIYFHLLQSNDSPAGSNLVAGLNRKSREFLGALIDEGIQSGDLHAHVDSVRTAYLLNILLETLLRTYYTDFLAPDLGLYRADKHEIDRWVKSLIELAKNGLEAGKRSEV